MPTTSGILYERGAGFSMLGVLGTEIPWEGLGGTRNRVLKSDDREWKWEVVFNLSSLEYHML